MDIILIAGLWLHSSVWHDVEVELARLGLRPIALAVPGVDDRSATATLDDQIAAVLAAVDGAASPIVVGHSAAATLAWLAADRRPGTVAGTVMIGGFPAGDGSTYADFFPAADGVMAFPGWEPFDGADTADLDMSTRDQLASVAIPVPTGVSTAIVRYADERRFEVPAVLVCPEFDPEQARAWMADGQIPELAAATQLSFVDIDSGHWPMVTKPVELARLIGDFARESSR